MPPRYRTTAKFANQAIKQSTRYASKGAVGLARWATTDHTGTAKFLTDMPSMGFRDTFTVLLVQLLYTLLGIAGSVAVFLLLFTVGLPLLFVI